MPEREHDAVQSFQRPPWKLRMALNLLRKIEIGNLSVELPDGACHEFTGKQSGPTAALQLNDYEVISRVLKDGDLGFAEAYMDGEWDTSDMSALLRLLRLNNQALAPSRYSKLAAIANRILHALRRNNRYGSRRNIAYHYDLGNDFYKLWLDETMTYSSAVFATPEQSLAEAQRNKYRLILEQLECSQNDHILEIGCGWGGFALYAARQTGCRVTGITLSREQFAWAREAVCAAGLEDRVNFRLQDYRDVAERYDRVVSIEMYEAVGEQYWSAYFAAIRRALVIGGRAVLQAITVNNDIFADYRKQVDFIQKYIFPGGMLGSPEILCELARQNELTADEPRFYGAHYAETLHRWHREFIKAEADVRRQFDKRFFRMWRYYLTGCEAEFAHGNINLMQITLRRH